MGMIRSTLEEVEQLKNDAIREIQTELKKIREAHSNMVKTYEGKLSEFGIPVEELGFDPLVPANIWARMNYVTMVGLALSIIWRFDLTIHTLNSNFHALFINLLTYIHIYK